MDVILIGLLGGLITGISPCILPVLPVIFLTGGAQSARFDGEGQTVIPARRNRPFLVIAGLVISFTFVTLVGSVLLGLLHLPQDIIRWAGLVVLALLGTSLLVPRFEQLLEKPFQFLPRKDVKNRGSGFGVGIALGAVFVPCAGPVLAAIIVAGSSGRIGAGTVALTLSFAIGVAVPLLVFALAGRSVVERIRAFRTRERGMRIAAGVAMIALAAGLAFNVPQLLQRLVPDYTSPLQEQLAGSDQAAEALGLGGLITDENRELDNCVTGIEQLQSCGLAPRIRGIEQWFNTDSGAAVELDELRGRVVLIDFWAYSCINCQRSIPHVVDWDETYRDVGLTVIGIHSPEYAFEKNPGNVAAGIKDYGITYPVALDNSLSTWTNYRNRYWPAHYLIDAEGVVRHIAFGEGNYAVTEKLIRELLADANPNATLPTASDVEDTTPELGSTTAETFLGSSKEKNFAGRETYRAGEHEFALPSTQPEDSFALDGLWNIATQYAEPVSGEAGGTIRLTYRAAEVRMVTAGSGTVIVRGSDGLLQRLRIDGTPRSYQLILDDTVKAGTIDIEAPAGVQVYSFTFG